MGGTKYSSLSAFFSSSPTPLGLCVMDQILSLSYRSREWFVFEQEHLEKTPGISFLKF